MRICRFISSATLATAVVVGAALVSIAPAAKATTYNFSFVDATDGVTATGTIGVVGGFATSGTGTVTSPPTGSGKSLTLLTGSGVFSERWGGTDLIVDNVVPLNGNGLLFGVGPAGTFAGTLTGYEFGVNIWSNGGSSYTLFYANSAGGSGGYNGTFSLTATPLPSTWTMLIAGFVGVGFLAYRGTKKGTAAIAAA
jgi:hypothetical protein